MRNFREARPPLLAGMVLVAFLLAHRSRGRFQRAHARRKRTTGNYRQTGKGLRAHPRPSGAKTSKCPATCYEKRTRLC